MTYVDGFVVPVPKKKLAAYRRVAQQAGRVWISCGALEYRECVGEDLAVKMGRPFPRQLNLKAGETVVFSWIVYRSRAHRDRVNAKVMKDPRIASMGPDMPFDVKRMVYGGFETLVDLRPRATARRGAAASGARPGGRAQPAQPTEPQPSMH